MPINAIFLNIDEARMVSGLREAREKLDGAEGEIVLDFSSVRRVEPSALDEIEALITIADQKNVKVVFRAINVEVYKVLKLVNLTRRMSFVN
jgi:anti-anti-sigma regulatory factor